MRGHRDLVPDPAPGPVEVADCPEWLSARGRDVYDRLSAHLVELGVPRACDEMAVAALANAYATLTEAREALDRQPEDQRLIVKTKSGVGANPLIAIMRSQTELFHRLAADFGLTPASRLRLLRDDIPPPVAGESLEEMLQRGEDNADAIDEQYNPVN